MEHKIRICKNPNCKRYYHVDNPDPSFQPEHCCKRCRAECDPEFQEQDRLSQEMMRQEYEKQEGINGA